MSELVVQDSHAPFRGASTLVLAIFIISCIACPVGSGITRKERACFLGEEASRGGPPVVIATHSDVRKK